MDFPKLLSCHECSDQQFYDTSLQYFISPVGKKKPIEDVLEKQIGSDLEQVSAFPAVNDDKMFLISGDSIIKLWVAENCSKRRSIGSFC